MNIRFGKVNEIELDRVAELFDNRLYRTLNFGQFCDRIRAIGVRIV